MKQTKADRLAENLTKKFGLPVKASVSFNNKEPHVLFEPIGVHPNEGFGVLMRIGWRSLHLELVFGKFAAELLQQMSDSSQEKRQVFSSVARHILDKKGELTFSINGFPTNPLKPDEWPDQWRSLLISLSKTPLEVNVDDEITEALINLWVERFFGSIVALCPLEEIDENGEVQSFPEGAAMKIMVNRYERSRYNRTICINFHGKKCKVCEMDFEQTYGKIGNGFIHVHHVIPLSQLGSGYTINPIEDLVPVCPNCHAMLHKRMPPLGISELKDILDTRKASSDK